MKITKSKLKQIIKEELKNSLNEVKIVKQGFFKEHPDLEWEIFDSGKICFETHHEGDYSPSSVCVPLDELREILGGLETSPAPSADMPDTESFRAPDPRKTAELRQQTRAQGGYSGEGAWKSREPT